MVVLRKNAVILILKKFVNNICLFNELYMEGNLENAFYNHFIGSHYDCLSVYE